PADVQRQLDDYRTTWRGFLESQRQDLLDRAAPLGSSVDLQALFDTLDQNMIDGAFADAEDRLGELEESVASRLEAVNRPPEREALQNLIDEAYDQLGASSLEKVEKRELRQQLQEFENSLK